ncbi:hypothetical protein A3735_18855 [Oleiphilus sp. HI0061]|uniref:PcfJ domain-containing protein n=1 Tax=Oleiphilus sp. HI0061 TaxID=1822239 RepID=UPI0007CF19D7|nr:PcfJ domain-containing protein [Oleiphilus sp. HI0061]KZY57110.1 hypothetical protein A3735_18855 [Oleiphilus sp. HI0061]
MDPMNEELLLVFTKALSGASTAALDSDIQNAQNNDASAFHASNITTINIQNCTSEEHGTHVLITVDILGTRVFIHDKENDKLHEIEDVHHTLSLLIRAMHLSEDFLAWAESLSAEIPFDGLLYQGLGEFCAACHLLMFGHNYIESSTKFALITLLAYQHYKHKASLSFSTLFKSIRSNKLWNISSLEISKKHINILRKINNSSTGFIDLSPIEVGNFVFLGNKDGSNKKHITKLCHAQFIPQEMISAFIDLSSRLSVREIARLRCLYEESLYADIPDLVHETPLELRCAILSCISSCILFLLNNHYTLDRISSMSGFKIIEIETGIHSTYSESWGRLDRATFNTPYKEEIPGLIEYISSQNGLDEEGTAMNHCVAMYGASCASGETSIYKVYGEQRCTLAVCNESGEIIELYGHGNQAPKPSVIKLVQGWLDD